MIDHDPLCPTTYLPDAGACLCDLIARVRADANLAALEKIREMRVGWDADVDFLNKLVEERDAARARVVEEEQKVIDAHRDTALARSEVSALRREMADRHRACQALHNEDRQRWDYLKVVVDDRAHRAADIYREEGGSYWEGSMDAYGAVQSLINKAKQ